MPIQLVYETHSITEDNELAWRPAGCPAGCRPVDRSLDEPYPGGESWRQAVARVGRFLGDLSPRWSGRRVLIIGHVATRWGLDHFVGGIPLEDLAAADFAWQEGWEYLP